MRPDSPSTDFLRAAMRRARYEELEDGSFAGTVPGCLGVIAFAPTRPACEEELGSALEGWIALGVELGHSLPDLSGSG